MILKGIGVKINAFVSQVGHVKLDESETLDLTQTEENMVRCPHPQTAQQMIDLIMDVKKSGDTIGGMVSCVIEGCPVGLGAPVFDKLHADLGKAMLSINAVKGFEYGSGFRCITMLGSEHNDIFINQDGNIKTKTNNSGGIQGGISNGMPINFNVAFKPVATIVQGQDTVDTMGKDALAEGKGRHDPCVVPRAVPIVEAMAALVLVDHFLRNKTIKL